MKKRSTIVVSLVSVLLLTLAGTAFAAPASSHVYRFADAEMVPGASASLVRADGNVAMNLHTSELDPNGAYTVWWVVFNNPIECKAGIPDLSNCGEGDIFEEDEDGELILIENDDGTFGTPGVDVSVLHAAGHVVGPNGVGNFGGQLRENKLKGDVVFGSGLKDAQGAEIHLVVRTHGEKIASIVHEQISTFMGGCDVNVCADQQFAIFVP